MSGVGERARHSSSRRGRGRRDRGGRREEIKEEGECRKSG